MDLQLPDWTPEEFLKKIGNGCHESADKFETLEQIFRMTPRDMKKIEVHVVHRKYIKRIVEDLRRGV